MHDVRTAFEVNKIYCNQIDLLDLLDAMTSNLNLSNAGMYTAIKIQ